MDGGPTFPESHRAYGGLTKRQWYAGQIIAAAMTNAQRLNHAHEDDLLKAASQAFRMADAMIKFEELPDRRYDDLKNALDEAREKIELLEKLRPHWAQGFTTDSLAAQSYSTCTMAMWGKLGVDNQTAALRRIDKLLETEYYYEDLTK